MKILIVSATLAEIEQLYKFFENPVQIKENFFKFDFLSNEIYVLISGIGIYSTIYSLTKVLHQYTFDLVINAGIAGAFNKNLTITEVVFVENEQIADFGIYNNDFFISIFDTNLISNNQKPFENKLLKNKNVIIYKFTNIRKVNGLTSNIITSNDARAEMLQRTYNADIETMEGAAFFYVCLLENVKFIEIRSISNYVGSKDTNKWHIADAIASLNYELKILLFEVIKNNIK